MTRTLKLIAINTAVLAAIVLSAEGCVRVFHPEIQPTTIDRNLLKDGVYGSSAGLNPGARGDAFGAEFSITEDGFIAYAPKASRNRPSWLFLGDSVTMGIGVQPDSTFAGRVALAVSDSLRVLNPSVAGYASHDYLNVLVSLIHRPDLNIRRVTVFWCLNDIYPDTVSTVGPTTLKRLVPRLSRFVYRHVRFYPWLKSLLTDRPRTYYEYDQRVYEQPSQHLQAAVDNISRMKALADSSGAGFDVVVLPYEYQLRTGEHDPQDAIAEALDRRSIPLHDASRAMRIGHPRDYFLYGDGVHLSYRGHRELSRFVLNITRPIMSSGL